MDREPVEGEELDGVLRFLRLTNLRFGGNRVVLRRLAEWSRAWPPGRTVTVLDAGCGGGDLSEAILEWAERNGTPVRVTAVDRAPAIAARAGERLARWPNAAVLRGDALDAGRTGVHDYVVASLFLHHVPEAGLVAALRALDRAARRGVVVGDLRRTLPSYLAVGAISVAAGNRIVRNDGPLSVRRAFSADELAGAAAEAGLPYLTARREPWFRVSLAGEKP